VFENAVARALQREVHLTEDFTGRKASLGFLRDKEKREVDFVVVVDRRAAPARGSDACRRHVLEVVGLAAIVSNGPNGRRCSKLPPMSSRGSAGATSTPPVRWPASFTWSAGWLKERAETSA
jgi:hypothetical protein